MEIISGKGPLTGVTVDGIHRDHGGSGYLADSTIGQAPLAFELTRCVTKFTGLVTADTAP